LGAKTVISRFAFYRLMAWYNNQNYFQWGRYYKIVRRDKNMSREDIIKKVYQNRTDLSTFLIHLTKDQSDGTTAKQIFDMILQSTPHKLIAKNPVGFFCNHPNEKNFPDQQQRNCFEDFLKVICLTESPLDQIKHFIGKDFERNENNTVKYSEYGFVFTRDSFQKKGGNPCFYVCTQENRDMQSALLSLFDSLKTNWSYVSTDTIPKNSFFKIFSFVNIFGKDSSNEPIDYFWEREWRVPLQELPFDDQDLALALCPESEIDTYSNDFPNITFLSPQWSLSKMIEKILH